MLVAHTKLDLFDRVLQSRLPDLPLVEPFLISYFPPKIVERYKQQVHKHHLRREIIATVVTNALINQAGTTLFVQLQKETTLPIDQLAERYFTCDELIGGRAVRASIHAADYKVAARDQYDALLAVEDVLRHQLRWWMWNEPTWKLDPRRSGARRPSRGGGGGAGGLARLGRQAGVRGPRAGARREALHAGTAKALARDAAAARRVRA